MINAVERGMLAALIYLIDSIQGENDISLFNLLPGEQQSKRPVVISEELKLFSVLVSL